MLLRQFEILSKLGEGTFSSVYKVRREVDREVYALKRVKMGSLSSKERENALNQIRILASIHHPNVVGYKEAFIDQASKKADSIVMEFATNGDLAAKITAQQQTNTFLPEPTIWRIFIGLVQGLKQLHDLHIFHRDIKTANVFLYENDVAKLGDMNVSKISEEGLAVTQTGTPYYASPEVWKDQPYDQKSDIWSLGCVLYELICLKVPFQAADMEGLYKKVTRGIYARLPPQYSQELSAVIRSLLQVNAEMRPSCEKILQMASVRKRSDFKDLDVKVEMLKTIKGENFHTLNDHLPKPNYNPNKPRRSKLPLKSMMDSIEDKGEYPDNMNQIQSLPMLQKDRKVHPTQVSDRVMSRDKLNVHVSTRDRKKSETQSRPTEPSSLNSKLEQIRELKLPKVQNRYNNNVNNHRGKDRAVKHNQNSLRCHKLFQ